MPSTGSPAPPARPSLGQSQAEHARLATEIQTMQSVLVRLMQDVVDAETTLSDTNAAQLVEANEQLLLAALASQAQAETASLALEQAAQRPALDALTHLPTRSTLFDRFGQALAQARRQHLGLALLFVDLDDFKPLNDRFGHAFGDHVLCQVAERLEATVREGDTVSRYGGDEFLILLAAVPDPAAAQAVADKLAAALVMPMRVDGRTLHLSASIGVASFPADGDDLDTLTARADAAMYERKRRQRRAADRSAAARAADPGLAARPAPPMQPSQPALEAAVDDADDGPEEGAAAGAEDGAEVGAADGAAAAPAQASAEAAPATPAASAATAQDDAGYRLLQLDDLREANERLVLAAIGAQELQASAESALQRQGEFIQAVADELRNPTAPVHVVAAMLGRQAGTEPLLPRVQALVEQRLARMAQRVASLVEAAAAETGNLVLRRRELALAALVDAAATLCEPLLKRRRQHLNWTRPSTPIRLLADPVRLKLAIGNLLDSACIHTSMGGTITLTLHAEGNRAVLRIDDEGIAIPAPMLPHVFEPFVMDAHALDIQGASLGIGLTVSRALVQAHGGTLEAFALGPGRGSRFVMSLPMVQATDVPTADAPADAADGAPADAAGQAAATADTPTPDSAAAPPAGP
jgi:diguanylate cyclase